MDPGRANPGCVWRAEGASKCRAAAPAYHGLRRGAIIIGRLPRAVSALGKRPIDALAGSLLIQVVPHQYQVEDVYQAVTGHVAIVVLADDDYLVEVITHGDHV